MRSLIALTPLALAACVAPSRPPVPAPQPAAINPAPPPVPAPPPAVVDWPDRPIVPGAWSYVGDARGSAARYGSVFALRCDSASRRVYASRIGVTGTRLTLRATTGARTYAAEAGEAAPVRTTATLAAGDPQLDAMAFSRGRMLVGVDGAPDLILPVAPEFARVVEDCR